MKHVFWVFLMMLCSCPLAAKTGNGMSTLDEIAERYVKLVLRIGQYSPDMVDAYYGPAD